MALLNDLDDSQAHALRKAKEAMDKVDKNKQARKKNPLL
jgi:hypothetical protein